MFQNNDTFNVRREAEISRGFSPQKLCGVLDRYKILDFSKCDELSKIHKKALQIQSQLPMLT